MAGSSSHHSSRSFEETSALFPIETKADSPSPRASAASRNATPSAPLWDENPMLPLDAGRAANVAFRHGPATAIPRQLGPIRRAPRARTSSSRRSCRSAPSRPTSANPAEMTTSARTPASSASSAASSTAPAGSETDGDVDRLRDLRDRAVRPNAGDWLPVPVHGVRGAREVPGEDVAEQLAADRAAPPRGADHRDARAARRTGAATPSRRRGRAPRPARGTAPSSRSGTAPPARLPRALGSARSPTASKTPSMLRLSAITSATKCSIPTFRRAIGEPLEQSRADPAASDARRRLRTRPRRAAGRGAARSWRRRPRRSSPVSSVSVPSSAPRSTQSGSSERLDQPRPEGREAVEAQVAAPLGERAEELEQRVCVFPPGRSQPKRATVPEDDVDSISGYRHQRRVLRARSRTHVRAGAGERIRRQQLPVLLTLEHDLERSGALRICEGIVGIHRLVEREPVRREHGGIELSGGDQLHQPRRRERVDEPRRDRRRP